MSTWLFGGHENSNTMLCHCTWPKMVYSEVVMGVEIDWLTFQQAPNHNGNQICTIKFCGQSKLSPTPLALAVHLELLDLNIPSGAHSH
jgi:hypothetical protein